MLTDVEKLHVIDGPILLQLNSKDWKEAIPSIGARKVLMKEVGSLITAPRPPAQQPKRCYDDFDSSDESLNGDGEADLGKSKSPKSAKSTDTPPPPYANCTPPAGRRGRGSAHFCGHEGGLRRIDTLPRMESGSLPRAETTDVCGSPERGVAAPEHTTAANFILSRLPGKAIETAQQELQDTASWTPAMFQKTTSMTPAMMRDLKRRSTSSEANQRPAAKKRQSSEGTFSARLTGTKNKLVDFMSGALSPVPSAGSPAVSPRDNRVCDARDARRVPLPLPSAVVISPKNSNGGGHLGAESSSGKSRQLKSPSVADVIATRGAHNESILMYSKLMGPSFFSNLPIIDCHYGTMDDEDGPQWKSLWTRMVHRFCHCVFFIQCLLRMVTFWQIAWCAMNFLVVWLCKYLNIVAPFTPSIYVNVLIFPLSFSVNAAYNRREESLAHFANFKACCLSLYLSHHCWHFEERVPKDFMNCSLTAIRAFFAGVKGYLTSQAEDTKVESLRIVYDTVSEISLVSDVLRMAGLAAPLCGCLQRDLKDAVEAFEHLRVFSDYRTPSSIRAFIQMCVVLVPLVLAPFFADLATTHNQYAVYVVSFLLPLPFMLLVNVQKGLENPFSGGVQSEADGIRLDELQLFKYMSDVDHTALRHRRHNNASDMDMAGLRGLQDI